MLFSLYNIGTKPIVVCSIDCDRSKTVNTKTIRDGFGGHRQIRNSHVATIHWGAEAEQSKCEMRDEMNHSLISVYQFNKVVHLHLSVSVKELRSCSFHWVSGETTVEAVGDDDLLFVWNWNGSRRLLTLHRTSLGPSPSLCLLLASICRGQPIGLA